MREPAACQGEADSGHRWKRGEEKSSCVWEEKLKSFVRKKRSASGRGFIVRRGEI